MSSVGQGVGMVVGGVIGFYAGGNVALGASIGGAIGGYLDPPKGPKGRQPTASELAQQTAAYGVFLGRGYGTRGRYGNVFWIEGNTLVAREREASGGKGGAKGPATYDIYGTFAVGFGEGEIDAFSRLWFSGKLVFDGLSSSLGTVIASNENGGSITFYTGTATQLPDPRIQADLGADNTPAWRGMPYIVVKDWPMADFGNTLAGLQVKAEIIHGSYSDHTQQLASLITPPADASIYSLIRLDGDRIAITSLTYLAWNYDLESVHSQQYILGSDVCVPLSDVAIPATSTTGVNTKVSLFTLQSDVDCAVFICYYNTPTVIVAYDAAGNKVLDSNTEPAASLPYLGYRVVIDRGDVFLMDTGARLYKLPMAVSDGTPLAVESSAGTFAVEYFGASENYIFAVLSAASSPTSCTVYKIDRSTLATVATYTQAVSGSYAMICVVGDDEFYTVATDGIIWRWISGVPVDTGLRYTAGHNVDNRLLVVSPELVYVVKHGAPPTIHACWMRLASSPVILGDIVEAECLKSRLLTAGDLDTSLLTQEVRGYEIRSAASIRTGIEPLRAAWPFDSIVHGYKLKFVPRGGSVVATIDVGELGATNSGKPEPQLTISREMDSQLPQKVLVTYSDVNRDYDQNTGPGSERLNTDAVNVQSIDLGIVLNANEAAGVEEVLLNMYWMERNDVSFTLPPTRLNLEPSDVINITTPTATHELRLTQINVLTDGRLECQAKLNRASVYTPVAVGQESYSVGQVMTYGGPSNLVLLDVPSMSDAMNAPCLLVGMGGHLDGWPGGALYRSSDAGQTWASVQGFPQGMVSGLAINAIGAGRTDVIDDSSRLNIRLHAGDLYSVSQAEMLNGANWFAYGSDGRWEIIAAQNMTAESDGSITCADLLRGRFGTEWAMTTHLPYDEIVLLDAAVLKLIGMNSSDINLSKTWRAVTAGRNFNTASDETQTYSAINLKPLSPVYVNGSRHPVTQDWTITAIPRSRTPFEPFSGLATPIGESAELYEVDLYGEAGMTTLKRTVTGLTSPSCPYTSAQQVADFSANQEIVHGKFFQISPLTGRGYPTAFSINRPLADAMAYCRLLIHGNGTNGSTTITDEYGHPVTAYNGAALTTSVKKFGTAAINVDGTNDYFAVAGASDLNVPTGTPFSIAFEYQPTALPASATFDWMFSKGSGPQGNVSHHAFIFGTDAKIYWRNNASNELVTPVAHGMTAGNFYNLEFTSDGANNYKIYKNGVLLTSGSGYGINATTSDLFFGADYSQHYANGVFDEIAVFVGIQLHTGAFTPPTQEYIKP